MPTYDYRCKKCAHAFEAHHSMKAPPLKKCPKCGGKVERLIGTGAGILFKGSGFYQTDYRSKSYQESAKKDKPSEAPKTQKNESTAAPSKTSKDTKASKGS